VTARDDLVDWVEHRDRPVGDRVDRRSVAAADYGRQFSDPAAYTAKVRAGPGVDRGRHGPGQLKKPTLSLNELPLKSTWTLKVALTQPLRSGTQYVNGCEPLTM